MDRNSMNEWNLVIKVKHGDILRRFGALVQGQAMDLDITTLKAKIANLFKFNENSEMLLTYTDEDGDIVALENDDELHDAVITQHLNPLRIDVQSRSPTVIPKTQSGSVNPKPAGMQQVTIQPSHVNSAVAELIKSVPEPVLGALSKISHDVASKAVSTSPLFSELLDHFSRMGLPSIGQPSLALGGESSATNAASTLRSFNANDKPKAVDEPTAAPLVGATYDPVKEHGHKQDGKGKLTPVIGVESFGPIDVNAGTIASSDKFSNDFISSDWMAGKVGHGRDSISLGEGKATVDATDITPPVIHLGDAKSQSSLVTDPYVGSHILGNPFPGDIGRTTPTSSASMAPQAAGDAQGGVPNYHFYGASPDYVPLPTGLHPPHRYRRAYSHNDSSHRTFHRGIRCDGCGMHPIVGPRYKSNVKEDYDLCSICFVEMGDEKDYTRIDRSPFRSPRVLKEPYSHLPRFRHNTFNGPAIRAPKVKLESRFIQDVTVLDGTMMAPSTPFTKIWRMRNNGTIPWPYGTRLVWIGGDQLANQRSVELEIPGAGYPVDQELDIAVDFVSPSRPGRYVSYWRMATSSGQKFGQRVWVLIQVDDLQPPQINLNLPPESVGPVGSMIIDVNVQPSEPAVSGMADESVNPFVNDVPVDKPAPASVDELLGASEGPIPPALVAEPIPPISYPIIDVASSSEPLVQNSASVSQDNNVEQTLLKELEEMGFHQIDLNKEVLRLNEYNLEQSVDDLCGFADWDPLLQELQEMGFSDREKNKTLLIKNGGSIKRVVLDLITGEKS